MTTDQKPRRGGDSPTLRRVCASCEFQVLEQMQGQITRQMVCHRMPPTVSMATTPQGIQGMTLFPIVQPSMWCHEWSPRHAPCDGEHVAPACEDPQCWHTNTPKPA